MINTGRALKTASVWISVVYAICFGGVALFPNIRGWFMKYALHTSVDVGVNVITPATFATGLIIWNVVAIVAVWLFVVINNNFNKNI